MGRSRGGLTTKVHALVDARGLPIRMVLTAGQVHDSQGVPALLEGLTAESTLVADKGYDADWIRTMIEERDAAPNIPVKSNRKRRFCFSRSLYRERNRVERFFCHMKQFRRVVTRYEKLAANYLAMLKLAAIRLWLRAYESTP
jgi:transposase